MKSKETSNLKIQQILFSLFLNGVVAKHSEVGVNLRDTPFESDVGVVNSHSTKRTNWFVYVDQNHFHSNGEPPPAKPSQFIMKRKGYW